MSRIEKKIQHPVYGEGTFAYGVDHYIGVFVTVILPKNRRMGS